MAEEKRRRIPEGVKGLLRDIAIAFLLVAIVMASLFAFTRVWPPMVVVESASMQHSKDEGFIGVIDTGDIVLVQSAPRRQDIITYVEGRSQSSGFSTYSDHGDVIIFAPNGDRTMIPLIHRALLALEWNETVEGFDIPTLLGLEQGVDWDSNRMEAFGLGRGDYVELRLVTYRKLTVRIQIDEYLSRATAQTCPENFCGFITMGDNNVGPDAFLTRLDWIQGRARGEVPWFGLLKLVFSGGFGWGDSRAPANSWSSLTIAIVLLIAGPIAIDVVLSILSSRKERKGSNPKEEPKSESSESSDDSS